MKHINFLKEVLMSEWEYWIVGRMEHVNEYGKMKRVDDSILLIAIPENIRRGLSYEEILLSDLEKLHRAELNNIFITGDFPPFQYGITMHNIYAGYPIKSNVHKFMLDALALKSNSIWDYSKMSNSETAVQVSDTTTAASSNADH